MKFKSNSIALFLIAMSIVPFLIQANETASDKAAASLGVKRVNKDEENTMFDLYANGNVLGMPLGDKLPPGPTYFQGWVKYFHYENGDKTDKPSDFYINNEYFHQRVLKSKIELKDTIGLIAIPSKFHFFVQLTRDNLVFLSSRDNTLQKVVESMQINLINPIPKDDQLHGGVQNLGEFDEGYCLQILTSIPEGGPTPGFSNVVEDGISQNWVICFDKQKDKALMMKLLMRIKNIKQLVRGDNFEAHQKKRKPSLSSLLTPKRTPNIEHYNGPGKNLQKDGFWVLLQDWSQCTLKCGGGSQYQQWVCQPPLEGGKPCQGLPIRIRPCNIQPCPNIGGRNSFGSRPGEEVAKPIIKSLPWSSRLQRYIQCEVKESDVLYIKRDVPGKVGQDVKYPGRLVMTNRTISLYEDDTYEKNLFTFNLHDTAVDQYEKDFCCMLISSLDKQWRVCGFNSECGSQKEPEFIPKWMKAFKLFSSRCYVDLVKKNWKDELKKDEDEADNGGTPINQDMDAREGIIKRKMAARQQLEIDKKITTTQELALRAIRKELKLERLLKNEEKMRERNKLKDLLKLKLKEEKKKECLDKALKDREDENNKGRNLKEAELEITRIKIEAQKEVEAERLNLRKKIMRIKTNGKRRRRALEQKINVIRTQMAKNLLDANKNGDMLVCKKAAKDPQLIKEYCDQNFVDSYSKNTECKEIDHFCPICCQNEFGNLFLNKRDECYKMCDDLVKADLKGDWIWAQTDK